MSLISRFPEGLLALLDLKSRGISPAQLGPVVTPIVDMLPYYEAGQSASWVTNAANVIALNSTAPVRVPDGEIWLVRRVFLKVQCIAVGAWTGQLTGGPNSETAQLSPFAELGIGVGQAQFTPSAIGQSVVLSWEPKVPFIANSGWGWYAYTDQVAGTHSGQVGVLRTRY